MATLEALNDGAMKKGNQFRNLSPSDRLGGGGRMWIEWQLGKNIDFLLAPRRGSHGN